MIEAGEEVRKYFSEEYKECPAVISCNIARTISKTSVECMFETMGNCWVIYPKYKEEVLDFEFIEQDVTLVTNNK